MRYTKIPQSQLISDISLCISYACRYRRLPFRLIKSRSKIRRPMLTCGSDKGSDGLQDRTEPCRLARGGESAALPMTPTCSRRRLSKAPAPPFLPCPSVPAPLNPPHAAAPECPRFCHGPTALSASSRQYPLSFSCLTTVSWGLQTQVEG